MKVEFVNMNYNLKEIRFLKINIWVEAQIAHFQHCSSHGLCDGDSGDSVVRPYPHPVVSEGGGGDQIGLKT